MIRANLRQILRCFFNIKYFHPFQFNVQRQLLYKILNNTIHGDSNTEGKPMTPLAHSHVTMVISKLLCRPGYLAAEVSKPFTFSSRMKRGRSLSLQGEREVHSFTNTAWEKNTLAEIGNNTIDLRKGKWRGRERKQFFILLLGMH